MTINTVVSLQPPLAIKHHPYNTSLKDGIVKQVFSQFSWEYSHFALPHLLLSLTHKHTSGLNFSWLSISEIPVLLADGELHTICSSSPCPLVSFSKASPRDLRWTIFQHLSVRHSGRGRDVTTSYIRHRHAGDLRIAQGQECMSTMQSMF